MSRARVLRETVCVKHGDASAHATLVYNEKFLPLESAYRDEIQERRGQGKKLGQVILLQSNEKGTFVIVKLIRALWRRIRDLSLDEVYIAIDPSEKEKYERMMFRPVGWE